MESTCLVYLVSSSYMCLLECIGSTLYTLYINDTFRFFFQLKNGLQWMADDTISDNNFYRKSIL